MEKKTNKLLETVLEQFLAMKDIETSGVGYSELVFKSQEIKTLLLTAIIVEQGRTNELLERIDKNLRVKLGNACQCPCGCKNQVDESMRAFTGRCSSCHRRNCRYTKEEAKGK